MARKLITILALVCAGCTIAPVAVQSRAPSFSGNAQTGGVIDLGPGNKGPAHVDAGWVADYTVLAKTYGKDMTPPVKPGDGVTALPDGTYAVDFEHLADKNVMATLRRSGFTP